MEEDTGKDKAAWVADTAKDKQQCPMVKVNPRALVMAISLNNNPPKVMAKGNKDSKVMAHMAKTAATVKVNKDKAPDIKDKRNPAPVVMAKDKGKKALLKGKDKANSALINIRQKKMNKFYAQYSKG